jgi:hypothetical protein
VVEEEQVGLQITELLADQAAAVAVHRQEQPLLAALAQSVKVLMVVEVL